MGKSRGKFPCHFQNHRTGRPVLRNGKRLKINFVIRALFHFEWKSALGRDCNMTEITKLITINQNGTRMVEIAEVGEN